MWTKECWDVGKNTADGVAADRRTRGYEARVGYEPGFGWYCEIKSPEVRS